MRYWEITIHADDGERVTLHAPTKETCDEFLRALHFVTGYSRVEIICFDQSEPGQTYGVFSRMYGHIIPGNKHEA